MSQAAIRLLIFFLILFSGAFLLARMVLTMIRKAQDPLARALRELRTKKSKILSFQLVLCLVLPLVGVLFLGWRMVDIFFLFGCEACFSFVFSFVIIYRLAKNKKVLFFMTGFMFLCSMGLFFAFLSGLADDVRSVHTGAGPNMFQYYSGDHYMLFSISASLFYVASNYRQRFTGKSAYRNADIYFGVLGPFIKTVFFSMVVLVPSFFIGMLCGEIGGEEMIASQLTMVKSLVAVVFYTAFRFGNEIVVLAIDQFSEHDLNRMLKLKDGTAGRI